MATFSENLNGSNCHLQGQTLLSLQVTEDEGTDFASATATCLAPSGPHALRSVVQTTEGGVQTGSWVVDKRNVLRSGEKTWRRREGAASYAHLPYVTYRLRRVGWLEARATISERNVGGDNWPPRFVSARWNRLREWELYQKLLQGEISFWEYQDSLAGVIVVGSGSDLIQRLAGWFGMGVSIRAGCPVLPEEYSPVGQTLFSAVREVASWSGNDVYLDRAGRFVIYSFQDTFRGGAVPRPVSVLEHEEAEEIPKTTLVAVVGERYSHRQVLEESTGWDEDGHWVPSKWSLERTAQGVEYSSYVTGEEPHVEERHEVKEHSIDRALAQKLSRQRIARQIVESSSQIWRGPAEGSQNVQPLVSGVLGVNRTLQWDGMKYRYEIEIRGPRGGVTWDSPTLEGWW